MADLNDEKVREQFENLLGHELPPNCKITITIEPTSGEELADKDLEGVAGGALGTFPTSFARFSFGGGKFRSDLGGLNFNTDRVSVCW